MMRKYRRQIRPLRKLLLNIEFISSCKEMGEIKKELEALAENVLKEGNVKVRSINSGEGDDSFREIPSNYNCVIFDMEGSAPVKLFGILLINKMHFFSLKDDKIEEFYDVIISILRIIKNTLIFTFTFWDIDMIDDIANAFKNEHGWKECDLEFIEQLKFFNLQERDMESVSAALTSIGVPIPSDPLYRRGRTINQLYKDGFYDMIEKHNFSCLKSECEILFLRFLKKHLIFTPKFDLEYK